MISISLNAIAKLRLKPDATIFIKEIPTDLIVDIADSEEEAANKCFVAETTTGANCKYYETSRKTMDDIREATKNVDLAQKPGQGFNTRAIAIPDIDLRSVDN